MRWLLRLLGAELMEQGTRAEFWLAPTETSLLYRLMRGRAVAITFGRVVLFAGLESYANTKIRRHELVHVAQYAKQGLLGFWVSYLASYFRRRFSGLSHRIAYLEIPQEAEAYDQQDDVHLPSDP